MFKKGDFVTINNEIGVVIFTGDELPGDMDDHTGVWFGPDERGVSDVYTIPTEYLKEGPEPVLKH
jgi:hypothetical protein